MTPTDPGLVSRRTALSVGALATTAGTLAITGCDVTYEPPPGEGPPEAPSTGEPGQPPRPGQPGADDSHLLGPASAVPVGGGTIYAAHEVVVTQPSAGTFAAFSSICTHMRCFVSKVENGGIYCPCHGSRFSIVDGSVMVGPATAPLPPRQVSEDAGNLRLT